MLWLICLTPISFISGISRSVISGKNSIFIFQSLMSHQWWPRHNKVNLDSIALQLFLKLMDFFPKMTLTQFAKFSFQKSWPSLDFFQKWRSQTFLKLDLLIFLDFFIGKWHCLSSNNNLLLSLKLTHLKPFQAPRCFSPGIQRHDSRNMDNCRLCLIWSFFLWWT